VTDLLTDAEQRARDLITFADGVEAAGMTTYAQRARVVAHDTLKLAEQLRGERRLRIAMQNQRDEARRLFLEHSRKAAA